MAKSVRSSVRKRNSAKLRSRVFGPVVDARTERLSAKLQKLASEPRPVDMKDSVMDADASTTECNVAVNKKDHPTDAKMDIDGGSTSVVHPVLKSRQSTRMKRRGKKKNSITFPQPTRRSKMVTRKK